MVKHSILCLTSIANTSYSSIIISQLKITRSWMEMDNNDADLGLGISSVSSGGTAEAIQSSQNIGELNLTAPGKFRVVRRNGSVAAFDVDKISVAMTKAFLAVEGNQAAASARIH